MNTILYGKITKPQGLKGEFRVKPKIMPVEVINKSLEIIVNNQKFNLQHFTKRNGFVIVKFKEFDDINEIEKLINMDLYINLEDDSFIFNDENKSKDLLNKKVYADGIYLGEITEISNFGSADVFTMVKDGSEFLFPNIEGLIIKVDKDIIINKSLLEQIIVN